MSDPVLIGAELTEVRQFKSHMDIFRAEVRQMIAKPPAVTTITFRELGQNALKRPRLRLPLPPHKAVTWDDDVWQQLVQDQPRIGDQTFSGVQSALAQLLHTVPTNMPFQLHGVSSTPSVCGDDLKPDAVISLHGHPLTPVTTSCILFLKPPDAPCNTAENVGKAIVHGREFLQQLPSSLRQSVHVGLTDLHSIVLVQASYTDQDRREFRADVSEEHFDVKDVLLRFLNQDPLFAGVVLPLLGPNTKIMGFLDYGATSHVYRAIVDGREVSLIDHVATHVSQPYCQYSLLPVGFLPLPSLLSSS